MQPSGDQGTGTTSMTLTTIPTYRFCDVQMQPQDNSHLHNDSAPANEDANMEQEKKAIYRHPLFPLMALLFEKCEQASQTPDCPTSDDFDDDIQAFVRHQQTDKKAIFVDDTDLDELMVKAIQVLRIHLLELEKVSELCKDFCTRYITCLKGKLQSEQLLRMDNVTVEGDEFLPIASSQPQQQVSSPVQAQSQPTLLGTPAGQIVSNGQVYQMVQTHQGLVAQPISVAPPMHTTSPAIVHGSTPLSQIGIPNTPTSPHSHTPQQSLSPTVSHSPSSEDDRGGGGGSRVKRGVLPKHATQVMKSWLFQHIVHPYPTEDEKKVISQQTGLSILQINNWFINARRRILQPMLDASNPEAAKNKKPKPPQSRPSQRFWPENIANAVQGQASLGDGENESMDEGEEENSPPPSMVEGKSVSLNNVPAPLILHPNGQLTTLDGQVVHQHCSTLTPVSGTTTATTLTNVVLGGGTGAGIVVSGAGSGMVVSGAGGTMGTVGADIVSSMIHNVQQAAEKVVQNGQAAQTLTEQAR